MTLIRVFSVSPYPLTHKPSHANLVTTVNDFFSISLAPTFGYYERFKCFWRAPRTLLWLNAIYRLTLAVISCWYLARMQTSTFDTKYLGSKATSYVLAWRPRTDFRVVGWKLHCFMETPAGTSPSDTSPANRTSSLRTSACLLVTRML
jgi:hypothetical protein